MLQLWIKNIIINGLSNNVKVDDETYLYLSISKLVGIFSEYLREEKEISMIDDIFNFPPWIIGELICFVWSL